MNKSKPVRRLYSESIIVSQIYPKPSILQQTVSHSLCGSGVPAQLSQLPLAQGLTGQQSKCQPGLLSNLKLNREELTHVAVAGFNPSWTVGLRTSVPHCLLLEASPLDPCNVGFSIGQLTTR